jgi:acyl carrier protein
MAELICSLEEELDVDFGEPEGIETIGALITYIESL